MRTRWSRRSDARLNFPAPGLLPIVYVAAAAIIASLPLGQISTSQDDAGTAPALSQILRRPGVQLAIIAAAVGFSVMSLIMTATPISMHVMDQHSVDATADVIRGHLLAMFAPSLLSGWLISKFGLPRILWAGLLLEALCVAFALSGQDVWHYRAALIALGIGWNFLFVGGTTLLTRQCTKDELTRVQGINDFIMFAAMVASTLFAGLLVEVAGWVPVNLIGLTLLTLVGVGLLRANTALRTQPEN